MVQVSYAVAGIFVASIVVSTLLVGILPPLVNRQLCDVAEEKRPSNVSLQKRSTEKGHFKNNFYYKKYHFQKTEIYDDCPEVVSPPPGQTTYPWLNKRLTSNVRPIHYDIEIFVPNYDQREFNGLIDITFEIVENATDTFIVHTRNNILEVFTLQDKNENYIDISCAVEYPKNEYFVFKTARSVQVDESPLRVQFFYEGEIDSYESGIFQADFLINNQIT